MSPNMKLVELITMSRHGTTTPGQVFPEDPNFEEWTSVGTPETLTKVGLAEHCELGRFLKLRYGNFLQAKLHHPKTKIWR